MILILTCLFIGFVMGFLCGAACMCQACQDDDDKGCGVVGDRRR